jgi:glycosyltransferase involved in cell wall biosynthesis
MRLMSTMPASVEQTPWVIVAGGFHHHGGMDRANAALAAYLLESGVPVHLVGHEIDPRFVADPLVTVHVVPRPRGLPGLSDRLLGRTGSQVARQIVERYPHARVVVNGGNCEWPDINWVHAVHAAWPVVDGGAPWWSRCRNRWLKAAAVQRERTSLQRAGLVIANSDTTRRALIERVGVTPGRIRTVYLGSDPSWNAVGAEERAAAVAALRLPPDRPVVLFVGAMGTDVNKGFDVLWRSWLELTASGRWDASLVVAGDGWRLAGWRAEAARSAAAGSVRFLGFTPDIRDVLAAGDLLVSPVRYESYGLNVHEALCRGLAVMVTRSAGVVERFEDSMREALLPDGIAPPQVAERLRSWRTDVQGWRARAAATGARLRARSWADMAAELVAVAQGTPERASA